MSPPYIKSRHKLRACTSDPTTNTPIPVTIDDRV